MVYEPLTPYTMLVLNMATVCGAEFPSRTPTAGFWFCADYTFENTASSAALLWLAVFR